MKIRAVVLFIDFAFSLVLSVRAHGAGANLPAKPGGQSNTLAAINDTAAPKLAPNIPVPPSVGGKLATGVQPGTLTVSPMPLPGEFAVQTFGSKYVTAVDGGGRTTNVIHTVATQIRAWEKFRILGTGPYALQTARGSFFTAVNGGGLSGPATLPGGQLTDAIHSDATKIAAWEQFRFTIDQYGWRNAIRTTSGHYLTAVGAGGKTSDAIHTNAVQPNNWEQFYVWKCGSLGSGYQYTINANNPNGFLYAWGGGGRFVTYHTDNFVYGAIGQLTDYRLRPQPFDNNWQKFRLFQQADGSYALQTSNGVNFVSALKGGGLPAGTRFSDNLVTDRTEAQAWEKFKFIERGACTYVIQTASGHFLGKSTVSGVGLFSTDVADINNATRFRLSMVF